MSKSFIIITSIFQPTEAVEKFSKIKDKALIVVGDKKSPADWSCNSVKFLSVKDQEELGFETGAKLPFNHYGRKLMGYLYAIQNGAEVIIDTDDDNIPYENWAFPPFEGEFEKTQQDIGFINMYKYFTSHHIWPRGFPLDLILSDAFTKNNASLTNGHAKVGIWQGLADSDPDVDAIYRLIDNKEIYFDKRAPIVLNEGAICPFNSQNTAVVKELFPLLYLPSYVTFRYTDILRGLVAQPIMWKHGYQLGFTEATVKQLRNPHDYLKDFESEIPCYLYPQKVIDWVSAALKEGNTVAEDLYAAYEALHANNIVSDAELELLTLWIKDINTLIK